MKKVALILAMMFCFIPLALAEPLAEAETEEEVDTGVARCPFNTMTDQDTCMKCHKTVKTQEGFKWGVKEDSWLDLPYGTKMVMRNGNPTLHYLVETINAERFFKVYELCREHGIKYVEAEINSPGGSVVDAWRIVAMMQTYPEIHTTTKCYGFAASAGFTLLVSGDERIVSKNAMLMAHELWTIKFLSIETPAGSQDEAEDLKKWQDNINAWLAERSNLTAEEIAEKIHKRDWWMLGSEAVGMGFADKLAF